MTNVLLKKNFSVLTFTCTCVSHHHVPQAFAIGLPDTVVKLILGVMHERLWEMERLRTVEYRRAWKTATWKVFAISSTVLVATMYGNYSFAIKLGPIDTVFKSLNYYVHELVWDQISWGVPTVAPVRKGDAGIKAS